MKNLKFFFWASWFVLLVTVGSPALAVDQTATSYDKGSGEEFLLTIPLENLEAPPPLYMPLVLIGRPASSTAILIVLIHNFLLFVPLPAP